MKLQGLNCLFLQTKTRNDIRSRINRSRKAARVVPDVRANTVRVQRWQHKTGRSYKSKEEKDNGAGSGATQGGEKPKGESGQAVNCEDG